MAPRRYTSGSGKSHQGRRITMAQPLSSIIRDLVKSSRSIAHSNDFEGHKLIQTNSRQLFLLDLKILYWCPASRDHIKPLLVQPQISCNANGLAVANPIGRAMILLAGLFLGPLFSAAKSMAGAMCIKVVDSSQKVCCPIHPGKQAAAASSSKQQQARSKQASSKQAASKQRASQQASKPASKQASSKQQQAAASSSKQQQAAASSSNSKQQASSSRQAGKQQQASSSKQAASKQQASSKQAASKQQPAFTPLKEWTNISFKNQRDTKNWTFPGARP